MLRIMVDTTCYMYKLGTISVNGSNDVKNKQHLLINTGPFIFDFIVLNTNSLKFQIKLVEHFNHLCFPLLVQLKETARTFWI